MTDPMQSSPSSFPSYFFTIHLLSSLSFYWLSTWIFFTSISCIHGHAWILKQVFVSSVQFSRSVVSNSLWSHGLQHTRLPCPSPTPGANSNSQPSSRWCHPTISSSVVPFSSCLQSFLAFRVFSNESVLHIRWPKYWSFSFSISPSHEYSELISFRMD